MINDTPKLVTLGHMARKAGVTTKWLRSEAEAGRVPCLKAGDRLLFLPDAVIDILSQRAARYQSEETEAAQGESSHV